MRGGEWLLGLVLLGVGLPGIAAGGEPDPEEVRRRMEKYEQDFTEEASKKAPAPMVDYDHEAWKSAERCGKAACFRVYLEDYPKGRYAKMARARLESESESRPAAEERPKPPSRPVQTLLVDRYRDNVDGTVTDVRTRLQWMRCSLGQTWQGETCVGAAKKYAWQAALDAVKALNRQGGYASYRDWRVPKKKELQTLVYCSNGQPKTWNDTGEICKGDDLERPTLYQPAFPNTPGLWYWSSSTHGDFPDYVFNVSFVDGHVPTDHKLGGNHVRLVRGGQ